MQISYLTLYEAQLTDYFYVISEPLTSKNLGLYVVHM